MIGRTFVKITERPNRRCMSRNFVQALNNVCGSEYVVASDMRGVGTLDHFLQADLRCASFCGVSS